MAIAAFGLVAAGQINDAETPRTQSHRRGEQNTVFVGTTVHDGAHHPPRNGFAHFLRLDPDDTADSAHASARGVHESMRRAPKLIPNTEGANTEAIFAVPAEENADEN
jgi:hypothetical protein